MKRNELLNEPSNLDDSAQNYVSEKSQPKRPVWCIYMTLVKWRTEQWILGAMEKLAGAALKGHHEAFSGWRLCCLLTAPRCQYPGCDTVPQLCNMSPLGEAG